MKTLLHICCAPCSVTCIDSLRAEGAAVTGFWYNHNIHPYQEYKARRDTLKEYAGAIGMPLEMRDEYGIRKFTRQVAEHLDAAGAKDLLDRTLKTGMTRIKPHKEHMSSFISLVILADTIDEEAKKLIKKTRFQKYFRLALHGWMEYHIAAMECSTNNFLSNPAGKGVKKILEQNLGSGKKN